MAGGHGTKFSTRHDYQAARCKSLPAPGLNTILLNGTEPENIYKVFGRPANRHFF
jgi:hypothetical protein